MATVTTSGTWTSVNKSLPQTQGLSSKNLSWGVPYSYRKDVNPGKKQSGYSFEGVTSAQVPTDGTEFKLGTFTHHNFGLNPPPIAFSTNLKITLSFDKDSQGKEFNFAFEHNETDGWNVPDEVTLPAAQSKETVTLEGTEYALHITGFKQDGKLVSKFISQENGSNSAEIFAKLVAVQKPEVKKPEVKEPYIPVCPEPGTIEPRVIEPTPQPLVKQVSPPPPEEKCRVKNVVITSTVFSAALERLNRRSVLHLLDQVISEVNEHCEKVTAAAKGTGGGAGPDLDKLRAEFLTLINSIRTSSESNVTEINNLKQLISSLQVSLKQNVEQHVHQTLVSVDLTSIKTQIENLSSRLVLIQKAAQELDQSELGQVEALLKKLLANLDLRSVVNNIQVNVDGRSFDLTSLVEVLATVDQVVTVQLQYGNSDLGDLTGARFILTDQTVVVFLCRLTESDGNRITYVFETKDWKGVPAQFSLSFVKHSRSYKLCAHTVSLDLFDGVEQTNVVFDLCPQIVSLTKSAKKV